MVAGRTGLQNGVSHAQSQTHWKNKSTLDVAYKPASVCWIWSPNTPQSSTSSTFQVPRQPTTQDAVSVISVTCRL